MVVALSRVTSRVPEPAVKVPPLSVITGVASVVSTDVPVKLRVPPVSICTRPTLRLVSTFTAWHMTARSPAAGAPAAPPPEQPVLLAQVIEPQLPADLDAR